MTDALPEPAQDLPPAAKHILDHLMDVEERTQQGLVDDLFYSRQTVYRSAKILDERDLIDIEHQLDDGRERVYRSTVGE